MRGMNTSQMGRTLIELRFGFPRHQATYRIPLAVPDQSTAYLHDLLTDESHLETLDAIRSAYYSLQKLLIDKMASLHTTHLLSSGQFGKRSTMSSRHSSSRHVRS